MTGDTLTVQAIRNFDAALSDGGGSIPYKRFWDLLEWQRNGHTQHRWRAYTSRRDRAIGRDTIFSFTAP